MPLIYWIFFVNIYENTSSIINLPSETDGLFLTINFFYIPCKSACTFFGSFALTSA
jgi:hypothetical protein